MGGRGIFIRRSSDVPVPDLFAHRVCQHLSHEPYYSSDCSQACYKDRVDGFDDGFRSSARFV